MLHKELVVLACRIQTQFELFLSAMSYFKHTMLYIKYCVYILHSVFCCKFIFRYYTTGCSCHDAGSTTPICNSLTGQCQCTDNVISRTCDECKFGYWGLNSEGIQYIISMQLAF